jgi:glycosyltransferase involved in cell wall biosynthesis
MLQLHVKHSAPPQSESLILVISSLRGGGAERAISTLANHWVSQGIEVTLATLDRTPDFYRLDPRVKRVDLWYESGKTSISRAFAIMHRVAAIRRLARSLRPDAILSFLTEANVLVAAAGCGLNTRVVVAERNHPQHAVVKQPYRLLRRVFYPRASAVVVQTQDIADWVTRHTRARRVTVIPNHVAVAPLVANASATRVCFLGRLAEQKAVGDLLHAFASIALEYPSWTLWIGGTGPLRTALESTARDLGIESKVTFLGPIVNTSEFLAGCSVFVLPSRYEGFPNALLEAMTTGLATIASDRAGTSLVRDGHNGLLYPSGRKDLLAACLRRALSDEVLRARLGSAARLVQDDHRLSRIAALWDNVLFR